MAVSLNLITFSGGTVTPKTDGIIYDSAIGQCGVFYGCNITASGNIIYVSSGYGIIRGRFFEMNESSVAVTLSSSATLNGRVYLRLDLSNTTNPLQLLVATGSTLPDLTQEEDANFTNGVWEMELATFEVGISSIDNLVETFETVVDNNARINGVANSIMPIPWTSYSINAYTAADTFASYVWVIGKLCIFSISFQYVNDYTPADTQIFVTGMPAPAHNVHGIGIQFNASTREPFRFSITKNATDGRGVIQNWYNSGFKTYHNQPAIVSGCYVIE